MKDSGIDSNAAILPRRASGYVTGKNGLANAGYIDMTIPFSAGAIYSTTEDLLRWQQGLFGGKLLSAASLKKMTTPFKQDYAFGLIVTRPDGHLLISHTGGIEGFNTRMDYYPDDRLSVIVLGNVNGRAPEDIASKLGAVALGKKVVLTSERKTVAVDAALVGRYLGSYRLADGPVVVISREGDHVFAQLGNQPKVEIFPASDTQFFLTVVDAQVDFIAGKDAPASEMVLHQGGRDVRAARIAN
jgi:CubicO group peptidase (beta-lactamase class C family)